MDAAAQQRVQELTQEVITKFASEFTKAYTEALIDKVKAEVEGGDESEYQLESAPLPSEPLKTGIMTKQGGFIKNWKSRFFVAYNAADNYRIDYLDKEGGKVKGFIACCGYRAEVFSEEDTKKFGENGVKLVGSANRRVWYLRANTKEERDEWLDVLKLSCYKAKPQRNQNELVATAFDTAYWRVRWWFCLWGSYTPWGTEDERLCDLLLSILDREVLWDVVSKLPSGAARGAMESAIRTPIEASVKAAVGGSWTSSVSACSGMTATLENTVKQSLSPLLEEQKKIKDKVVNAVNGIIQPVLAEKGAAVLRPILAKACGPIGRAFARGANDFYDKVKEMLANNEFEESKFTSSISYLDRQCYWILYKAYDICWDMCFNGFAELASCFANGITYYDVYYMSKDAMNEIFYNAVYTFSKIVKEGGKVQAALTEVMGKYIHDCKIAAKNLIVAILRALLDTPVQELMLKPAGAAVEPIQAVVDAIPVPGLSTLMNLTAMTQEVVERIVNDSLTTLVESGFIETMNSEFKSIKL